MAIKSTVQSLSLLSVSLERHRVEAMSSPCAAGVIMFSDILTPLPSMGIDFDVIKGSGPCIFDPIRSMDQASLPCPTHGAPGLAVLMLPLPRAPR